MGFHSFAEYLKYRLRAKSRHGIHSPFVYKLIDECLAKRGNLRARLDEYFGDKIIEMNILSTHDLKVVANDIVLLISDIHKSPVHTKAWNELVASKQVLLSIDLYTMGLLLSRNEFKEKQHFVLKA